MVRLVTLSGSKSCFLASTWSCWHFFFLIFSMLAVMEPLCGDNLCFLAGDNSQPGACPVVERHLNSLLKDQLVSSCS